VSGRIQSRIRPNGGKRIAAIMIAFDDSYHGVDVDVDSMTLDPSVLG